MAISRKQEEASHNPPADQRTSNELAKLIGKLRWMGMDEEAEPLMDELARRSTTGAAGVVAPSRETD